MEYPIILFQELILIFLVLKYKNLVNTVSIAGFGVYMSVLAAFALKIVPTVVLSVMAVSFNAIFDTKASLERLLFAFSPSALPSRRRAKSFNYGLSSEARTPSRSVFSLGSYLLSQTSVSFTKVLNEKF
jgi:hypothetical protein